VNSKTALGDARKLWTHIYGDLEGFLCISSAIRNLDDDGVPIKKGKNATREFTNKFFRYPEEVDEALAYVHKVNSVPRNEVWFSKSLFKTKRRGNDNVVGCRALAVELDGPPLPNGKLTPTAEVLSSPAHLNEDGKDHFHIYLAVPATLGIEEAAKLNKRLGIETGGAKRELSGLLRPPGATNYKHPEEPLVELLSLDEERRFDTYILDAILPEDEEREYTHPGSTPRGEPPVRLSGHALEVWGGKHSVLTDGGEIDRSSSLCKLAGVLWRANLQGVALRDALEERDSALGWEKYTGRPDADKRYWEIVELVSSGESNVQEKSDSAYSAYSADSTQDEVEWVEPTAFHSFDRPAFPTGIFPSWMEDYVDAVALATQTPRDLAGMLGISVVAAALAKKMEVEVWYGWFEPLNLYIVITLRPGTRKSEVYRRMTTPISEVEEKLIMDSASEIARARSRKNILEARLKNAEKTAAKDDTTTGESMLAAMDAARELSEAEVPSPPQLMIDDATPEALEKELSDQGGRVALMSPEGGIFDIMAGRYSRGEPNIEVYLKGHAGDDLTSKRLGRDPVVIKGPALTIALCVQPSVLQGLAGKPGFRGRGLLGRFLYSMPEDNLGSRKIRPPAVPKEVEERYQDGVKTLLEVELPTTPTTLHLSEEAQGIMEWFSSWIEPQLAQDGDLGSMTDWAGKLAGAVARIAAVLHVMDQELPLGHPLDEDEEATTISADALRRAVKLGKYLLAHAKHALAFMGTDPVVEDARWILGWIEKTQSAEFSKRDAFNASRHIFDTVTQMDPVLDLLLEHGYLRKRDVNHPGPGQKPSPRFEVNPLFLHPGVATQNTQNTQNANVVKIPNSPDEEEVARCLDNEFVAKEEDAM
jgi:replicative DNA helicase